MVQLRFRQRTIEHFKNNITSCLTFMYTLKMEMFYNFAQEKHVINDTVCSEFHISSWTNTSDEEALSTDLPSSIMYFMYTQNCNILLCSFIFGGMLGDVMRVLLSSNNSHAQIYDGIAGNKGMASKGAILQGYKESLVDSRSRERCAEKLELMK